MNYKHLLSGLTESELDHPTVKKILDMLLNRYDETGQGLSVIKWFESTYGRRLLV